MTLCLFKNTFVLSGENRSPKEGKITCSLSVTGLLMIIASVACEL